MVDRKLLRNGVNRITVDELVEVLKKEQEDGYGHHQVVLTGEGYDKVAIVDAHRGFDGYTTPLLELYGY